MVYHDAAIQLLMKRPESSSSATALLNERERELGIKLPESVREWYSLRDSGEILRQHSNSDYPVPLSALGKPEPDWCGEGPRDFVHEGLLVFMGENQGVCDWAVRLDGSPDPPVVVQIDTAPNEVWLPCADRFSTFVFCQIWDHTLGGETLVAHEPEVSSTVLRCLHDRLQEKPRTYAWPAQAIYRFEGSLGRIRIRQDYTQAWWVLASKSQDALSALLQLVEGCGAVFDKKDYRAPVG